LEGSDEMKQREGLALRDVSAVLWTLVDEISFLEESSVAEGHHGSRHSKRHEVTTCQNPLEISVRDLL
jgi:hypothetical protein